MGANLDYSHEKAWILHTFNPGQLGLHVLNSNQYSPTGHMVFVQSVDGIWLLTKFLSSELIQLTLHSFCLRGFSVLPTLAQLLSTVGVGQD